ncbi:hypothetical protein G6F59_017309 [Rhizopus arrhizus]|nr:hypothetical protein G6F59_017309 [Rhizopus arrhizus]
MTPSASTRLPRSKWDCHPSWNGAASTLVIAPEDGSSRRRVHLRITSVSENARSLSPFGRVPYEPTRAFRCRPRVQRARQCHPAGHRNHRGAAWPGTVRDRLHRRSLAR